MAVAEFYGMDPQAYGWDMTQFKTEEEKILLEGFVNYQVEASKRIQIPSYKAGLHEDGLILLIGEMNLVNWDSESFFMKKAVRDFNFKKKYDWRYFDVLDLDLRKKPIRIYYKLGIMPRDPDPIDISSRRKSIWAGWDAHYYQPVTQGGILYKKRRIWEKVNFELAFHDNPKYFKECVLNRKILLW